MIDDDEVYWGDIPENADPALLPSAKPFIDALRTVFVGQRLLSFRELCGRVPGQGDARASGLLPVEPMAAALQQAFLAAVAAKERQTPAEVLVADYGLPALKSGPIELPIILEISDFAATAERIEQMLALRPAGIGYRLTGGRTAEAIGGNAEFLQRFVRELAERIDAMHDAQPDRPAIYLAMQGALGALAGDPRRQMGHILGNCAGLQSAAGALDLYLEEPIFVNDPIEQASLMRQLKDYCQRSTAFTKQPLFAIRRDAYVGDEWSVYSDIQAVDVLALNVSKQPLIDSLMSQMATVDRAIIKTIVSYSCDEDCSYRWTKTGSDMAIACSAGLLLSYDNGSDVQYRQARRYVSELSTWLSGR